MPDLNLACKDCVFIPKNRQNRVRDNDFDELHYQCAPRHSLFPNVGAVMSLVHLTPLFCGRHPVRSGTC